MAYDQTAPKPSRWKAKDQEMSQHGQCRKDIPHHEGEMNSASNSSHPGAAHSRHNLKTFPRHAPYPTHPPAVVWKSEGVKERDRFDRTLLKVSYLAPGFVKCGLFPQNQDEWRDLRFDYICDQLAVKDHDKKVLAARIEAMPSIPLQGRTIKSIFGPEGKEMKFAGSSVLGWSTIWSKYQHCHAAQSVWPNITELLTHGDNRGDFCRLYRSFPLPRTQDKNETQSFEELQFLRTFPLDEIEPEFTCGPPYAEYTKRNAEDDNDESFKVELEKWLDTTLKEAISGEVEKWLDVVTRERNGEKTYKILAMDKDEKKDRQGVIEEKGGQGKTKKKNEQRRDEGKDQQGEGEKKHQQAPNKGNRRRRLHHHAQNVYAEAPVVEEIRTPQPLPGAAVVKIEIMSIIYDGTPRCQYPTPPTRAGTALGHIAALPIDSMQLRVGQLVLLDCVVPSRSRDKSADMFLANVHSGYTDHSHKPMADA
ncbi:hypothetical protein DV736_g1838, partial [Chaetothyriales sp. CBS 134916]